VEGNKKGEKYKEIDIYNKVIMAPSNAIKNKEILYKLQIG
jgi:hypothetical protein